MDIFPEDKLIIPNLGVIIPNMSTKALGISNILFSKSQQQVLGLLYSQPDSNFYTNEIIRLTKSGTGAVQRELAKFVATGLVTVTQVGNQKHYQANRASPFFSELRGLILKTFGMADVLREALLPLAKEVHFAFIYGSIAKQEDTANSDIDLMVITDKLTYGELFQQMGKVEEKLGRKINPTFYKSSEWVQKQREMNNFIAQVLKQPKIFLIGTEDELLKLKESSKGGTIKGGTF
jgi:predicted nucleotidyltransferase